MARDSKIVKGMFVKRVSFGHLPKQEEKSRDERERKRSKSLYGLKFQGNVSLERRSRDQEIIKDKTKQSCSKR